MSQPEIKKQPITQEEKALLRKTASGTIVIAVMMLGIAGAFTGFALSAFSGFMSIALAIFLLFFMGILFFIISVRIRQANASEKTVYTGVIREKKAETSGMRNSTDERYKVLLDDEWFTVEAHIYDQLHAGEKTALHTIANKQVFKTERLETTAGMHVKQEHSAQNHQGKIQRNSYYSNSSFENISDEERSILRKAFRKAFIFRTLICGFAGYILFYVIMLISILSLRLGDYEMLHTIFYADLAFLSALFLLANRKTIRIIMDLQNGQKIIVEERVLDKVSSNTRKPGPRSVVSRSYNSFDSQYYYIQTSGHWLSVSEHEFNLYQGGDTVKISLSKRSKIILGIS